MNGDHDRFAPGNDGEISTTVRAALDAICRAEPQEAAVERVVARALQIPETCSASASQFREGKASEFDHPAEANRNTVEQPHPEAVACLNPNRPDTHARRRTIMTRAAIFTAAAAILVSVWLGISHFPGDEPAMGAFTETLQQIQSSKTITWKQVFYERVSSKDGKRTWLKRELRQLAFKTPGWYREVALGENGQIESITITDATREQQMQLLLVPAKKKASLTELAVAHRDPLGPFEWVKKELKDSNLQWVGKRKTAAGEANVFRHSLKDNANGGDWSYDFWIDPKSKRLVELHVPGSDIFDPETAPDRNNPPEKAWSTAMVPGRIESEIVCDANLDDSLFRLEPPEGYALESKKRAHVSEKEMVEYLGIVAGFNGNVFPETPGLPPQQVNKVWLEKPEKEWTPAERKYIETFDRYMMAGLNLLPVGHFREDSTAKDSFRYLGKGVKLGDKDRIVCWYKLKDAKDPSMYRVVYGDLSVKDVAGKDLPLPVQP